MKGDDYSDADSFMADLASHPEEWAAIRSAIEETSAALIEDKGQPFLQQELRKEADERLEVARTQNPQMKNITCRTGCTHCCRQLVLISEPEAKELVQVARQQKIPIDYRKLMRQSTCGQANDWSDLNQPDRDCIFLKDNLCQVYEQRPLACRKYFSVGDPALCNIETNPKGSVPVIFNIDVEILTAATMMALPTGFMPQMLLSAIRKEGS